MTFFKKSFFEPQEAGFTVASGPVPQVKLPSASEIRKAERPL